VGSSRSAEYRAAAAAVVARDAEGVTVRLQLDEWPITAGAASLDQLLAALATIFHRAG